MTGILVYFLVQSAALLLLARVLPGVRVDGWGPALLASAVLAAVNTVVKPVLFVLTLPFTIVTLGLFLLVLNAMCLWLVQRLVPGFEVRGAGTLVVAALALSVVGMLWKALASEKD